MNTAADPRDPDWVLARVIDTDIQMAGNGHYYLHHVGTYTRAWEPTGEPCTDAVLHLARQDLVTLHPRGHVIATAAGRAVHAERSLHQRIRELAAAGNSDPQIGRLVGRTTRAVRALREYWRIPAGRRSRGGPKPRAGDTHALAA